MDKPGEWIECPKCKDKIFVPLNQWLDDVSVRCSCNHVYRLIVKGSKIKVVEEK